MKRGYWGQGMLQVDVLLYALIKSYTTKWVVHFHVYN